MEPVEQKPVKKEFDSNKYWMMFAELATEFAFIFAVPLIGAIYLGKWLDAKYNTKMFLMGLALLAIVISWVLVYRKIKKIQELLKK